MTTQRARLTALLHETTHPDDVDVCECGDWAEVLLARGVVVSPGLVAAARLIVGALPDPLRTGTDGQPVIDTLTTKSPEIVVLRSVLREELGR